MLLIIAGVVLASCSDDDEGEVANGSLTLNLSGLEDLGAGFAYEGWVIVDGSPVTTGTFTVDANGALSQTTFEVSAKDLENATAFVLSIEPSPDSDPAPADTLLMDIC